MKIGKLFVANRGEIACRIAQTANKMGIRTCGVYTPQDAHGKHVRMLDEVMLLPSGDLADNYLNADLLIQTALRFRAHAVHPGYGFLAENPDFAEKILASGLVWVGPKPEAMRALGDKINAKEIATSAGVPVAPWMRISKEPGPQDMKAILHHIGLPLLIKAARGGGGRGQRIVRESSQFRESLRTARSESLRSFGSEEVFVERFLERPRHIEVQIIGDEHGNCFALGERDCTLQRRNQKVIEESPAAILDAATREPIHDAAKRLASAVHYTNAGTIEFLAQQNGHWDFYFMELNARIQVEHPVTEMLWNIDLVELQLRVAQGENLSDRLPLAPSGGHAIEVRLCAENPENHFLPTPGPIVEWILLQNQSQNMDFRLDSGFDAGDVIPREYDSLFAKLIVKAETREKAIRKLTTVLDDMLIAGIITNQSFLRWIVSHPDFAQNNLYTRWIDAHPETLPPSGQLDHDLIFWAKKLSSELFVQRRLGDLSSDVVRASHPPMSQSAKRRLADRTSAPQEDGITLAPPTQILTAFIPAEGVHGEASPQGLIRLAGHFILPDGERIYASGWIGRFELCVSFRKKVEGRTQRKLLFAGQYEVEDLRTHHGPIVAQVPGVVLDVRAKADQVVAAQEPILVVEAMKIEIPMSLPVPARIISINVKRGDRIHPGQTLVTWEPAA